VFFESHYINFIYFVNRRARGESPKNYAFRCVHLFVIGKILGPNVCHFCQRSREKTNFLCYRFCWRLAASLNSVIGQLTECVGSARRQVSWRAQCFPRLTSSVNWLKISAYKWRTVFHLSDPRVQPSFTIVNIDKRPSLLTTMHHANALYRTMDSTIANVIF